MVSGSALLRAALVSKFDQISHAFSGLILKIPREIQYLSHCPEHQLSPGISYFPATVKIPTLISTLELSGPNLNGIH